VTSELLSGPDLGAGFLHQLSIDQGDEGTAFTYHAQDGGLDAGGPPKGPLDVLGFVHPPSPCMFGGPRCWHRRFLLSRPDAPQVRRAYNRNRFVLQTMMDQVYDQVPAKIEPALQEVVRRISERFDAERIPWFVGGSTAAWLLGASVVPHDIDLGTSPAGVDRMADLLAEYLIEPLAPTDWPTPGRVRGVRAFVGTFREGARVEWSVPLMSRPSLPFEEWSGNVEAVRLVNVPFFGRTIRVTRPEYALVRALEKRQTERIPALTKVVRQLRVDFELLDTLFARSSLSASERTALRAELLVPHRV